MPVCAGARIKFGLRVFVPGPKVASTCGVSSIGYASNGQRRHELFALAPINKIKHMRAMMRPQSAKWYVRVCVCADVDGRPDIDVDDR